MRIEISACEMAPDMLVGFLFQLPVRDGVAMLASLHVARQDFLFQLRPPSAPLAHGTRSRNGALVQWKVPAHWQDRVPCLTAVGQLYLGNGWRPIRVQEPSVSPSRPIGWVVGPCFATHSLPFLEKADMLPTQHNCSPGVTQQNMQVSLSQPLQNSHVGENCNFFCFSF